MKTIVVVGSNPTLFVHDKGCPPSSSPNLNAVPKNLFNRLTCIWEAKNHIAQRYKLEEPVPPFIDCGCLVLGGSHESNFLYQSMPNSTHLHS